MRVKNMAFSSCCSWTVKAVVCHVIDSSSVDLRDRLMGPVYWYCIQCFWETDWWDLCTGTVSSASEWNCCGESATIHLKSTALKGIFMLMPAVSYWRLYVFGRNITGQKFEIWTWFLTCVIFVSPFFWLAEIAALEPNLHHLPAALTKKH